MQGGLTYTIIKMSGALLPLAFIFCVVVSSQTSPVVKISQGELTGTIDKALNGKEFFSFKGIPFAQPPTGRLRFKDPVAAGKWNGILDATKYAPMCAQVDLHNLMMEENGEILGSEDCLYLNVFTSKLGKEAVLPVMVFIHGGAWVLGEASIYPPHGLLMEDIVLVVIQYRVGTLGFLSTEDDDAPGNLGLKDQTMALKWVNQNIESFGGDPEKVTIFGESAGGAAVHYQLLTDESKGLFKRAILQSGTALCSSWSLTENPRQTAFTIGELVGCNTNSAEKDSSRKLVDCLQNTPLENIAPTFASFFKHGIFPLQMAPFVDGKYIKDNPELILTRGEERKVDLMAGVTRDDGAFPTSLTYTYDKLFRQLNEEFSMVAPVLLGIRESSYDPLKLSILIFKKYMGQNIKFADMPEEFKELMSDRTFRICTDNAVSYHYNNSRNLGKKVFFYEFHYRGKQSFAQIFSFKHLSDPHAADEWVCHADELSYLFPGSLFFKTHEDEDDIAMMNLMVKLWTNFASVGNPTPDESLGFQWEPINDTSFRHLAILPQPVMEEDRRENTRKFWSSLPLRENLIARPEQFEKELNEMARKRDEL